MPGGYRLPAGAVVICALHAIHNNPKIWTSPDRFNPDRWGTEEVANRPKNSYMPFATGPRSCIGFNFALGEVKVLLPELVYRYEFSKEGDEAVTYDVSSFPNLGDVYAHRHLHYHRFDFDRAAATKTLAITNTTLNSPNSSSSDQ